MTEPIKRQKGYYAPMTPPTPEDWGMTIVE